MPTRLLGDDFCELVTVDHVNGAPSWANINSVKRSTSDDMVGAGIYACYWDDALIYIGTHVGDEIKKGLFGYSVADRLHKHIVGFTLRSSRLFFYPGPLEAIIESLPVTHGSAHKIAIDLQAADREVMTRDRGICATFNKAMFAASHWEWLETANPDGIKKRFSATFFPVPEETFRGWTNRYLQGFLKNIENSLVQRYEPICNKEHRKGAEPGKYQPRDDVEDFIERMIGEKVAGLGDQSRNSHETKAERGSENKSKSVRRSGAKVAGSKTHAILPNLATFPDVQPYRTAGGQLRVRSENGRVLLIVLGRSSLACLAIPARLRQSGIEADTTASYGPMRSRVNFPSPEAMEKAMPKIVEASLSELL